MAEDTIDPDDAPKLGKGWFAGADLHDGDRLVRKGVQVSEAAKAKAVELSEAAVPGCHWSSPGIYASREAFARFIQEVSDAAKEVEGRLDRSDWADWPGTCRALLAPFILPEPVDPLLIEARELAADYYRSWQPGHPIIAEFIAGTYDDGGDIERTLAALRRGIELGREQGA